MKKTVIKRRKRVTAAPGSPNAQDRMTDQAAAEVLASVGRQHSAPGGAGPEESAEEQEGQPKRKRARKTKAGREREGMDVDEEDHPTSSRGGSRRGGGSRATAGTPAREQAHTWIDSNGVSWSLVFVARLLMGDKLEQARLSTGRPGSAEGRYGAGAPRGNPFSHMHPQNPHGGFDLPSIGATLGDPRREHGTGTTTPASYVRSGSAAALGAPSRTHSPLAGPGVSSTGPGAPGSASGYVLPPPHSLVHPHAYSAAYSYPPPPTHHTPPPVPSMMDLERHYTELGEEKRRLEDLLMRTDRIMAGVRRGMEEMRMVHPQATRPPSTQPPQALHHPPSPREHQPAASVQAVPLKRGERSSSSQSQRERESQSRESVWPVNPPEAPRE